MVAAYRRAKKFNRQNRKNGKSVDTRRCALPRGATCWRAKKSAEAWHRVKRAAPRMATKAAPKYSTAFKQGKL